MKLQITNVLFLFLIAFLAGQGSGYAQDKSAKIDELMKIYQSYGQFNGAALVAENGKVIYKKGLGLANMEWNIPNETDTKFRLGSITKQFTAALILQLVEQGKIKLDGNVSDYLPDYRKDVGDRVTIHHLLTHTSGIPSYTNQPRFFEDVSRNPFVVADFVKKYTSGDLEFEPGSKFSYNNSGYFLLGAIIEKVTGKPYEQVLKENILDPLGMKNTGYDHFDAVLSKRASGYNKTPKGYINAPYLDMSIPYAAGSLYSTVEDLYLWDRALYTDKLLSAKSKELMFKPNLENYGYGFSITNASVGATKETIPVITHGGGINGFNTTIVRLVGNQHLIVLLDNTSQGRNLDKISKNITSILYNQPYSQPKKSIAEALFSLAAEQGAEVAVKQYRDLKANQSATYDFNEAELNTLGYQLTSLKKIKDAIEIFKLNVEAYPQASNPYDSLGEAYMMSGNKELALKNYKKALELNPQNANAASIIKRLESPAVTNKADPKIYDQYVGEYQLAPNFVLTVTKEGDKLMGQATGQPKIELLPESDTQFFVKEVNAQVSFVKDEKGVVTALILNQNGQKIEGKRIK
ncbi:MAG: serine hydrolase [Acidobacteria bacterium]|nr:serine hydrolase [Acidobacteriota bacterium]